MGKTPKTPRKSTPADARVGRRIKLRRKLIQMSQSQLGDEIGVSFQQIQKYERGGNRIGASRLMEIARALRIDPSSLIDDGKPADAGSELERFLALPETSDLIRAVLAIDNQALRRQLVNVAMTFGKVEKADGAALPPAKSYPSDSIG